MAFFGLPLLTLVIAYLTNGIQTKSSNDAWLPHRVYGVPPESLFHDTGPPFLKYGQPKLNLNSRAGPYSELYGQIKNNYDIPKVFNGPPDKNQKQRIAPLQVHGPHSKQTSLSGFFSQTLALKPVTLPSSHKVHDLHTQIQSLPLFQPSPPFKPSHHPASSYGPPPSGPLHQTAKQIFGPPLPNYGPPPLPNFNNKPETAVVIKEVQNVQSHQQKHFHGLDKAPSVTESQPTFHTACEGWKPISYPAGFYIENNYIGSAYIQRASSSSRTGYTESGIPSSQELSSAGGDSTISELSDEELVTLALQSTDFDSSNLLQPQNTLPSPRVEDGLSNHLLNSIEAEDMQLSLGGVDDWYNKSPKNLNPHSSSYSFVTSKPSLNLDRPLPESENYRVNYGSLSPAKQVDSKYLIPPPPPESSYVHPFIHVHQYRKQSGNLTPFPLYNSIQPSKPIVYIPPVPQGLFEQIGTTVQHLDKFGVKPQIQAPIYIPSAANELPQNMSTNSNSELGALYQHQNKISLNIVEQQLPLQGLHDAFHKIEQEQEQTNYQYTQLGNIDVKYGESLQPSLIQQQPIEKKQYYLSTPVPHQKHFDNTDSSTASSSANLKNLAFGTNQYHRILRQQPHFNHCGHAPNLVEKGNFNNQQQQQDQKYSSYSGTSIPQSILTSKPNTQFISGLSTSYEPMPLGGNANDNNKFASQKSKITVLPDVTSDEQLPVMEYGINTFTEDRSEVSIPFSSQKIEHDKSYKAQFDGNEQEIISADLLQTILTAVEQPQEQHQSLPANHKTERSHIEIKPNDVKSLEFFRSVDEISPIAVKELNRTKI